MTLDGRNSAEFMSHFWTHEQQRFLHFGWPFDMETCPIVLSGKKWPKLSVDEANNLGLYLVDTLLSLETFAEIVSMQNTSDTFKALEEQRHKNALASYRYLRWADVPWTTPRLIANLKSIADDASLVVSQSALELVVEPLAAAVATLLHSCGADPLLVRMCSFIIADENYHSVSQHHVRIDLTHSVRSQLGELASGIVTNILADGKEATGFSSEVLSVGLFAYLPSISKRLVEVGVNTSELSDELKSAGRHGSSAVPSETVTIARDAAVFLDRLQREEYPCPPLGLAVEWLAAGFRSTVSIVDI